MANVNLRWQQGIQQQPGMINRVSNNTAYAAGVSAGQNWLYRHIKEPLSKHFSAQCEYIRAAHIRAGLYGSVCTKELLPKFEQRINQQYIPTPNIDIYPNTITGTTTTTMNGITTNGTITEDGTWAYNDANTNIRDRHFLSHKPQQFEIVGGTPVDFLVVSVKDGVFTYLSPYLTDEGLQMGEWFDAVLTRIRNYPLKLHGSTDAIGTYAAYYITASELENNLMMRLKWPVETA